MKDPEGPGLSKLARSVKRVRSRPTKVYGLAVDDAGTSAALIRLETRPFSKTCSFAARTARPYTQIRAKKPASTRTETRA